MNIKKSLSLKMTVVLIVIWVLVNITAVVLFRVFVITKDDHRYRKYIDSYLNYIVEDFGTPLDMDRVRRIARKNSVRLIVTDGSHVVFSNVENRLQSRILEKAESTQGHDIRYKRNIFFKYKKGGYIFYFSDVSHANWHDTFLVSFFVYISVLFGISYLIFRRMLIPVKNLQKGVDEISRGNREYEVPVTGSDELGRLAGSFNSMNKKINRLITIKDRLLIDVGHELKSPLARMKLALEFTDPKTKENLGQDIHSLEYIIDTILKTFKSSFEQNTAEAKKINLADAVEFVIKEGRFPPCYFSLSINKSLTVEANRDMLIICLKNLFSNAVKYSDPEKKPILVESVHDESGTILRITDYGIGIPENDRDFIFEPFYRVDKSRSRESGGTGLGLSLCRNIADIHKWGLEVDSVEDEYTTFVLRF